MAESGRGGRDAAETAGDDDNSDGARPRRLASARRLPLRTVLLIIVFVPSLTFTPLLASGMYQLSSQWRAERAQLDLATETAGRPAAALFLDLQKERRLTAEVQAAAEPGVRDQLVKQRAATDESVRAFRSLVGQDFANGQEGLPEAVAAADRVLASLGAERRAVDTGTSTARKAFDYYSRLLVADLGVLTALSHTDEGQVNSRAQIMIDLFWVVDTIGREDAVLARAWKTGRLTRDDYAVVTDAIGTRTHLLESRIMPALTGDELRHRSLMTSQAWNALVAQEARLATGGDDASGQVAVRGDAAAWRTSADAVTAQVLDLLNLRLETVRELGYGHARMLFVVFVSISSVGLLALGLVIFTSWRLTSVLRRRILRLREEAQELQERLPEVVARLERGEDVDVDAEVHLVEPTPDELGELGEALNQASRSAVLTAVRQAEQHRGFQRMLQRIARRTQILIGLQLKKLDELERRHEDPEVLEGLFDLDHLTARLRRYEENLVILGGGQPQRRWRRPVQLLDVLRAAQGEVQDYRRITIDVEGEPWVAERAVGPLVHVLAELMENATAFSKPLTPVEVRASPVSRGVAVEIEDRGLGMEPEQYAAANALMKSPPQLDVMTHADDVRLGLYVVARLSAGLGLQVELRPSAFGGARVIVLVPETLVVERPQESAAPPAEEPRPAATGPRPRPQDEAARENAAAGNGLPTRTRGRALANVAASPVPPPDPDSGRRPLPQRVRQANLAEELRTPATPDPDETDEQRLWARGDRPSRSGAAIGAFQRQSRLRRGDDDTSPHRPNGSPEPGSPTTEDR
ncbi:nitrate- and nitrite sensing domain-containing protein [Nonomuraea bangladeshensis]|uniref:sensor histidine kinase n=1 Tax=Nonomuraea bangladeshensis TaxID=404385 RepID=UPI003C2B8806